MKAFANVNPRDLEHAVSLLSIVAPERGRTTGSLVAAATSSAW